MKNPSGLGDGFDHWYNGVYQTWLEGETEGQPHKAGLNMVDGRARIYVHGPIMQDSMWVLLFDESDMVVGQALSREIRALEAGTPIDLFINSPGGSINAAISIISALQDHAKDAPATITVEGVAASAAALLAVEASLAFKTPIVGCHMSTLMIHRCFGFLCGNAEKLRAEAAYMDDLDAAQVDRYVLKCQRPREEIMGVMEKESLFVGKAALDFGLLDEISGDDQADPQASLFPGKPPNGGPSAAAAPDEPPEPALPPAPVEEPAPQDTAPAFDAQGALLEARHALARRVCPPLTPANRT